MRLKGNLDADMYKRKDQELGSLVSHLKVRLEGQERNQSEIGDMAIKLLGLSQTLRNKWLVADIAEKRAILELSFGLFLQEWKSNNDKEKALRHSRRRASNGKWYREDFLKK